MGYPLSLIGTETKGVGDRLRVRDGEENCTCSSEEEMEEEVPVTSIARVATTEYGGREVVETEENPM